MKILLVDDEQPARDRLRSLLAELAPYQTCGEASNGLEALQMVELTQPDIVLMDIRMPGMDGLEAAYRLARLDKPPAVIFITAYGEHALEAFDAHAIGYLLKPVRKEHLQNALAKARTLNRAQLSELADGVAEPVSPHICARLGERIERIPLDSIYYFQADQKYITVRHRNGESLIEQSLSSLEEEFAGQFLRIHRNALVAKVYLAGLEKTVEGHFQVLIEGIGDRLEVSRRHIALVRGFLKAR